MKTVWFDLAVAGHLHPVLNSVTIHHPWDKIKNIKWKTTNVLKIDDPLPLYYTSSSAVAERPREASCLSVVTFNNWAHSFIFSYFDFRFAMRKVKFCSVVFGVTSSLPVINKIDCEWRFVMRLLRSTNVAAYCSSDECHQLATVRRHSVYSTWRSHRWQHAMKRDIGRK